MVFDVFTPMKLVSLAPYLLASVATSVVGSNPAVGPTKMDVRKDEQNPQSEQGQQTDSSMALKSLGRGGEPSGAAKSIKAGKSSSRELVDRPHHVSEEKPQFQSNAPSSTAHRSSKELVEPLPVGSLEQGSEVATKSPGRHGSSQGSYKPSSRGNSDSHVGASPDAGYAAGGRSGGHGGGGHRGGSSGGGGNGDVAQSEGGNGIETPSSPTPKPIESTDEYSKFSDFKNKVVQGPAPYADGQHPKYEPILEGEGERRVEALPKDVSGELAGQTESQISEKHLTSSKTYTLKGEKVPADKAITKADADESETPDRSEIGKTGVTSEAPSSTKDAETHAKSHSKELVSDSSGRSEATSVEKKKSKIGSKSASQKKQVNEAKINPTTDIPDSIKPTDKNTQRAIEEILAKPRTFEEDSVPKAPSLAKMEVGSKGSLKESKGKKPAEDMPLLKKEKARTSDVKITPEIEKAANTLGIDLSRDYPNLRKALTDVQEKHDKLALPLQGVSLKLIEQKEKELGHELDETEFGELYQKHKLEIDAATLESNELQIAFEILKKYYDLKFKKGPAKIRKVEGKNPAEAMMNLFSKEEKLTAEEIRSKIQALRPTFEKIDFEYQYALQDPENISFLNRPLTEVKKERNAVSEEMESLKERYRKQQQKEDMAKRERKMKSTPHYAKQLEVQKEEAKKIREALTNNYPTFVKLFDLLDTKDQLKFATAKLILRYETSTGKFALEQDENKKYGDYKFVDARLIDVLNDLDADQLDKMYRTIHARRENDRFNAIKNPTVFVEEVGYRFRDEKKHEFTPEEKKKFALQRKEYLEKYEQSLKQSPAKGSENKDSSSEKSPKGKGKLDTNKFSMIEQAVKKNLSKPKKFLRPLSKRENKEEQ